MKDIPCFTCCFSLQEICWSLEVKQGTLLGCTSPLGSANARHALPRGAGSGWLWVALHALEERPCRPDPNVRLGHRHRPRRDLRRELADTSLAKVDRSHPPWRQTCGFRSFHTQATAARAATACPTLRNSSRTAFSSGCTGAIRCQAHPPRCQTRLVELAALALLVRCLG